MFRGKFSPVSGIIAEQVNRSIVERTDRNVGSASRRGKIEMKAVVISRHKRGGSEHGRFTIDSGATDRPVFGGGVDTTDNNTFYKPYFPPGATPIPVDKNGILVRDPNPNSPRIQEIYHVDP